ncbi:hypothetical protein AOG23_10695 [Rhizobium acidisoli]|nr:hypothetical protein AOG23_10695 [Rhizobium acidisoli]
MISRDIGGRFWGGAIPLSLIPVLVTGIQCAQVFGRERLFYCRIELFTAQKRGGWIPVTSTGMREEKVGAPKDACGDVSGEASRKLCHFAKTGDISAIPQHGAYFGA